MSNFKAECRKFQPNIFNKIKCSNCFRQREEHSAEALESNRVCLSIPVAPKGGGIKSISDIIWTPQQSFRYADAPGVHRDTPPHHRPMSTPSSTAVDASMASRKVSKCGYLFVAPDWDFSIPLNRTKRWQRRWFVLFDDGELTYSVDDLPATIPQGVIDMNRVLEVAEAEDVTGNQFALAITSPDRVTFIKGTCREESRWWLEVLSVFPRTQKQHGRHKRNATFPGIKSSSVLQQTRTALARAPSPATAPSFDSSNHRVRFHSCSPDSLNIGRPSSAPTLGGQDDEFQIKETPVVGSTATPTYFPSSPIYHSTPISSLSTRLIGDEHKENTPPYIEDYQDHPPTSESPPTQDKVLGHRPRSRRTAKREARGLTHPRSDASHQLIISGLEDSKREEKLKDIADSITRSRGSYLTKENGGVKPTREKDSETEENRLSESNSGDVTDSSVNENIRGDPDGCGGLDNGPHSFTLSSDMQRVELPAEDVLYIKKGWLMKQSLNKEWNKHWFVLQGSGLRFYRDPSAEDTGILDGIIDLGMVKDVEEKEVGRNYGFTIVTWDDKKYIFSAVTSGIRSNWVHALRNAANLKEQPNRPLTLGEKIEREIVANKDSLNSSFAPLDSSLTSLSRSFVSSDDDFKTASDATFFRDTSREDLTNYDRLRARATTKGLTTSFSKRSRSSPPSSRRGTRDDFPLSKLSDSVSCFSATDSVQSMQELSRLQPPEKDSNTGESVLVDLLETQVESLKAKLEHTQVNYLELHKENIDLKDRLSSLESNFNSVSSHERGSFESEIYQNGFESIKQYHPSSPFSNEKSSSTNFDLQKQMFASLSSEASNLRRRLKIYEADLDESEREAERLRNDKNEFCDEVEQLRIDVANLKQQIENLQQKLESQEEELREKSSAILKLESLNKQYSEERKDWQERVDAEEKKVKQLKVSQNQHGDIVRRLTRSLQEAELRIANLSQGMMTPPSNKKSDENLDGLQKENSQLNNMVAQLMVEIGKLKESLKSEKSEAYKWKDLVKELRSLLDGRSEDMNVKRSEMDLIREKLKATQTELDTTADRLYQGIEENESLCNRIRELERQVNQGKIHRISSNLSISSSRERFSSSRKNLPRINSLSDLTNFDMNLEPEELDRDRLIEEYFELRLRFEKAVSEIKALKREIRDAQTVQDDLELTNTRLKNEMKIKEEESHSQIHLMSTRIQDLTTKFTTSDKQVRTLKQKMSRAESRERRRTQSLKGKESFNLSKDMEAKLSQLESKVDFLIGEGDLQTEKETETLKMGRRSKSFEESTKASRMRRKSLDGQNGNEAVKAIVRINDLESKVATLSGEDLKKLTTTSCGTSSNNSSLTNIASSNNSLQLIRSKSPSGVITHSQNTSPLRSPLRSPSAPRKAVRSQRLTTDKFSKLVRSDSEPKILREKLNVLEKILKTLQAKLSECVSWTGALECSCTCGSAQLSRLQQNLQAASRIAQSRTSVRDQAAINRIQPLTLKIQELLREKITQLTERRQHLKAAGRWTRDAQLKTFAERLAFETLLLSQLAQVVQSAHKSDSYEASMKLQELVEAHRKLSFLEKKLTNPDFDMDPMTPLEFYTSLLAEKLVVESDVINSVATLRSNKSSNSPVYNETCRDLHKKLLERERTLANIVMQYKEEKLNEIAVVMARETVTGTQPSHDDTILLEELRLREAWTIAQDLITQELVNLEISQSVLQLSHLFIADSDKDPQLTVPMNAASLDRLHSGAEESLQQEMEESVFTLSNKYEEVLAEYRSGNTGIINSVSASMETVLNEFAAVIAQKALIDGQLAVATGDESLSSASEILTIVEEKIDPVDSATDVVASEAHLLMFLGGGDPSIEDMVHSAMNQAEFSYIYNKMTGQGVSEMSNLLSSFINDQNSSIQDSMKSLNSSASDKDMDAESSQVALNKIPPSPKTRKSETSRKSRRVSDITGMLDRCRQCDELRQELLKLKKSVDLKKVRKQETECKKCAEYICNIKHLEEDHRNAMEALQSQHQSEIDRLRDQVKYDPPTRDSDDELTELKRRLCLLEEGYESQIAALKKQYQEALGSQSDVCEENIRQRYQIEIEHLRELCEKGLNAMESSHRRLIAEMEEKHQKEMSALQLEKEEALAEETQATLAALDAMRKAHEAEVQKEVAKFKEEFLRRMENGREEGVTHSRLHEEELREVRREILTLSEKYSGKCLEMAAKEQRLDGLQRQLLEAKNHSRSLDERNRQLKQRISTQISSMKSKPDKPPDQLLKLHECEIALKNEEISRLTQMLEKSKTHESDLGQLCGQLNHYIRTERAFRTGQTTPIRDKLEKDSVTPIIPKGDHRRSLRRLSPEFHEQTAVESRNRKAVTRSPSCPGLSGMSIIWSNKSLSGSEISVHTPLSGMVALRKKVFEGPPTTKSEC